MVSAWLGSHEGPIPGCRLLASHCVLTWQRRLESSLKPFIWALISFVTALPSCSNHFLMSPCPNSITLGVRVSIYEFWEYVSIQSKADLKLDSHLCPRDEELTKSYQWGFQLSIHALK
jgi:hypothetical protein